MSEPDTEISFECPNCGNGVVYPVWRKADANRTHPWADYKVGTETCDGCGDRVTLQLKGVANDR